MPDIPFTKEQRQAIEATGRSVIVSAAAGSGKTAVLAERCAYLVCDAPEGDRCDVDELLVLTFTESAASEMRSRIVHAIRDRMEQRPADLRLREQAALVDAARISTIHAFCNWLLRRWFNEAGIDPSASLLGADEEPLLKREVMTGLFRELYGKVRTPGSLLGGVVDAVGGGEADTDVGAVLACAFARLVDVYGLGDDKALSDLTLKLFEFTRSLPDADEWLDEAHRSLELGSEQLASVLLKEVHQELALQLEHCDQIALPIEAGDAIGHWYALRIREYEEQLGAWLEIAADSSGAAVDRFDQIRSTIQEYEFKKSGAPRLPKDCDPLVRAVRDAASGVFSMVKNRLFAKRLKPRFADFSLYEYRAGLSGTAPFVKTIAQVVCAFRDAYTQRKRQLNVLDFSDLERLAYELLSDGSNRDEPSPIARSLHRQFVHVLVDEFQDINPLQRAIIKLSSRESDGGSADNLFVVGDVKQSIYRFRLAEPDIFIRRLERLGLETESGDSLFLQSNFRSRSEILEAVNLVFGTLMRRGFSEIVYDHRAQLRAGREEIAQREPVELHILESKWGVTEEEEDQADESGIADFSCSEQWTPIEREAFLIGTQIRAWVEQGRKGQDGEPIRFRDITVLLRSARVNAERMASLLSCMGVPAHADVGGSLFGTREVRDVTAALEVLDNPQQDIPLAAVLRSGIFGTRLSADELATVRCVDRTVSFHAAVSGYGIIGNDVALREELRRFFERVESYRADARCRPLADVLWRLYERQGYLAHVGGLPNGVQRRANLLKLHELARRFGTFRRQGLHRFLLLIKSLVDEERPVAAANALSETEDVLRIMNIHQAKGLEFPIVFVAGLGTKFNLGDRNGRMIFERKMGIGLRAVDQDRMIEYPTLAHSRIADEIERLGRQEDARILYVAMTRAKEKLVLVGSMTGTEGLAGDASPAVSCPTTLELTSATTPLNWLISILSSADPDAVQWVERKSKGTPLFAVHTHGIDEMSTWRVVPAESDGDSAVRRAVGQCGALPSSDPVCAAVEVDQVLSRLEYAYPQLAAASIKASAAASGFDGDQDFLRDSQVHAPSVAEEDFTVPPSKYESPAPGPLHRGTVTHRFLQHLDLNRATESGGVARELERMVAERIIESEDNVLIDQTSVEWFASTPLADLMRSAGNTYRREFMFTSAESLGDFDHTVQMSGEDYVLVRGIVDGILPVAGGIEIVDFKTDAVDAGQVAQRAERYRSQMVLYAKAMARLWRAPVRACWLVFLAARQCYVWRDGAWESQAEELRR